jgi:acyl-CoA synthetase (AMP-forming)/AMP-acid ligase II
MRRPAAWPSAPPSVVHLLADAARAAPGAEALVCGATRLTYAAYWAEVQVLAQRLRAEHGVAPGDRVAVVLPNGP